jgi:nucleoside-diphosphate-sugar epimerase
MNKGIFEYSIATSNSTIKEVMRLIDHSGLRVAYIIDESKKLIGAVSDSEIRRSILKGADVNDQVEGIINTNPVVLNEKYISDTQYVKGTIKELLERMPDSRFILMVDNNRRPKKLISCSKSSSVNIRREIKHANVKKVLVVGGAGYLGSVLVRKLLKEGFKVKVLDILMFGKQSLEELVKKRRIELIQSDMRDISVLSSVIKDVDAVINLAAIVGDPACKNHPETTIETNYLANKVLAECCKYHQINRFMFASSCSIYGKMEGDKFLDENSPLAPVSLYARSKIQSEQGILSLEDENFSPIILRMGTLYGYSPRMRFDLVVNTMVMTATKEKKIYVHGGGKQWRPLLHIEDAAEAFIRCLRSPIARIKGEVFNVGSTESNFQIIEIAKMVNKYIPESELIMKGKVIDQRNYFVSFSKIEKVLKFKARQGLKSAILRVNNAILDKEIKDVRSCKYYNVEYNK